MKLSRLSLLFVFLVSFLTPCFAHHLAVVVDKDNHIENITSVHLAKIIRADVKKWPDGKDILIVLRKDLTGETLTLQRLTKMSASELQAHFAAHSGTITLVDSDAEVLKLVGSMPGAMGFVEVRGINDQVNVVKVDGKLPMESGYLPHQ
ncbi:MAG: substrate-binding domain-containing protein [Terriglobales bacterium]|jgi:ABC-type phosphate transport system substrate-binding protein